MSIIQEFLPYVSKNICWDLQLDKIEGFSDEQIKQYCKSLNIEAYGELHTWLKTFGKCSGGLFTSDEYFLYRKRIDNSANNINLKSFGELNIAWQNDLIDMGVLTKQDVIEKKPYIFECYNETHYYIIYTTDLTPMVWYYCDGDGSYQCTGKTFFKHLKDRLTTLKCSDGNWLDHLSLLEISTSRLF
ncbi:hypothetical protein [Moraxella sp.]|uniref:hypothetical protein n=1 Tax=Moraxella sp. TaxID=479 RepID=UPI0026DB126E|nr:hypothetical protein [Moraxella sp.]